MKHLGVSQSQHAMLTLTMRGIPARRVRSVRHKAGAWSCPGQPRKWETWSSSGGGGIREQTITLICGKNIQLYRRYEAISWNFFYQLMLKCIHYYFMSTPKTSDHHLRCFSSFQFLVLVVWIQSRSHYQLWSHSPQGLFQGAGGCRTLSWSSRPCPWWWCRTWSTTPRTAPRPCGAQFGRRGQTQQWWGSRPQSLRPQTYLLWLPPQSKWCQW